MIESDPEWLRSLTPYRTLTEAQVHALEQAKAKDDWTPTERLEQTTNQTCYGAARH